MAAIDFPSAPTMGQEYPFGDFTYVWDGVKWTTKVIIGSTEESDARYVNSTGDTMSGDLSVIGSNSNGVSLGLGSSGNGGVVSFYDANGGHVSQIYGTRAADGSSFNFRIDSQTADGAIIDSILNYFGADRKVILTSPHSSSVQSTEVNALTRKDYVDAALLVKADVDRVNTLEATVTALLARIEALEAQVNPAP